MKNNLDSLRYIVTYKNEDNAIKRLSFGMYDIAYEYYKEKMEDYGNAKLFIEQTITTEIRIK